MDSLIKSFTTTNSGIVPILYNPVKIAVSFDPKIAQINEHIKICKEYHAIWDTGATNSSITLKVVSDCGLQPISITKVHTADGVKDSNVYLVSIVLPNEVIIPSVKVTECSLGQPYEVLIGMDVINGGDLAITNFNGKTVFSFRVPSMGCIDFNKTPNLSTPQIPVTGLHIGRNQPCPCGSGKKYKRCCGQNKP